MKIYLDAEYKCHVTNEGGNLREIQTDFFDGRCNAFIEGYRFVPAGENWTNSDGVVFTGEIATPWKSHVGLSAAQAQYKLDMAEAEAAYQEGVDSAYDQ